MAPFKNSMKKGSFRILVWGPYKDLGRVPGLHKEKGFCKGSFKSALWGSGFYKGSRRVRFWGDIASLGFRALGFFVVGSFGFGSLGLRSWGLVDLGAFCGVSAPFCESGARSCSFLTHFGLRVSVSGLTVWVGMGCGFRFRKCGAWAVHWHERLGDATGSWKEGAGAKRRSFTGANAVYLQVPSECLKPYTANQP